MDRKRFTLKQVSISSLGRLLGNLRPKKSVLLWIFPLGFLILFYFYPLTSIFEASFSRSDAHILSPFFKLIRDPSSVRVLTFTILQAVLSTLLTLLIGLPGAYLFARYKFRGKSLIKVMTGVAFVLPTLVVASAFNAMLGPNGLVNVSLMSMFKLDLPPIQFSNTFTAILVAHVFYNTTIVLRMVGDYWSHLDPNLGHAASVLGANRWKSVRLVTFPLLLPAIASAALLVFIFSFTSFGVILILGGPKFATIETEIYYQTVSLFNLPTAATLAILQLLLTLILTFSYTRLINRISKPISLRPQRYTQKTLSTWPSRIFAGIILTILIILTVTPLLALVMRSLSSFAAADLSAVREGYGTQVWTGFTLKNYLELGIDRRDSIFFASPMTSIAVSLGYAGLTMIIALLLGLPAAWALSRNGRSKINHFMDPILMLPLGTSAVTLGLGFIISLDRPPLDLRASVLLIPLAHTLVAFPFVVRSLTPALRSISPGLKNAASVLGASPWKIFQHVDLPLIGRAVLVGAIFAFTISLGEFGATALIARPEYPTIPIAIYRLISRPGSLNYGQALALSTILLLVAGGSMLVIERFRVADVGEF